MTLRLLATRLLVMSVTTCLSFLLMYTPAWAEIEPELSKNARSAILIDASTGSILFEKNSHEKLPPASITKIMTLLLVMEALDEGKIHLDDRVRVSEKAASMGGSQIFLEPGEQMSVHELLKGVAIGSANDATVALAEFLAGTEERFVQMMNEKVKELGLKNTHFVNTNGLPAKNHYSSAHDIAMMSRELLKHKRITNYTSVYEDYLRKKSKKPFWLVNTNKLIRFYPGMDGLKTGFTQEAKYCLAGSAKRDQMRIIAVVMGEPDIKTRNAEMTQLLDYAFHRYTNHLLFRKGDLIQKLKVPKGEMEELPIYADQDIAFLLKKGEAPKNIFHRIQLRKVEAPIQKGDILGQLQLIKDHQVITEIPIRSKQNIEKAGFWTTLERVTGEYLFLR